MRQRMHSEGATGRVCVYNSGLLGTFKHIIRTEGYGGSYRGILPEYFRVVPNAGIVFMTNETHQFFKAYQQKINALSSISIDLTHSPSTHR
ncbi:unnamed protein product [Musa hybrid cultivar]